MSTSKKSLSGVSVAIQTTLNLSQTGKILIEKEKPSNFTVKIANTIEEREAAFRLAYDVYLDKGFIKPNANQWLVRDYDFDQETVVLIAQDRNQNVVGSMTLVFDGSSELPAKKAYSKELKLLRSSSAGLVEISRNVIKPEFRNSKEILLCLFNYLAIYIYYSKRSYSHLIIEVNPRHRNYFKHLLSFEEIGDESHCPDVQNAPASLMKLPIAKYQSEIEYLRNVSTPHEKTHSLYPFFLKAEQEKLVAQHLEKQFKPLTFEEKAYFGYSESGLNRAVLV